jgi:hypothetical protein
MSETENIELNLMMVVYKLLYSDKPIPVNERSSLEPIYYVYNTDPVFRSYYNLLKNGFYMLKEREGK